MAENIGALEVTLGLKDLTAQPLGSISKRMAEIANGTSTLQKEFSNLKNSISALGNGNVLNSTSINAALKDVDKIQKAYSSLYTEMERSKKLGINIDTKNAQEQIKHLEQLMSQFFKGNGQFNKEGVIAVYGNTGNRGQWQNGMKAYLDESKRQSDELKGLNNKAEKEEERHTKALEKEEKKRLEKAEKNEEQAINARNNQIKTLQLWVNRYNNLIKNLQSKKATSPDIDHSKFDNTIARMQNEIRGLLDMLNMLNSTSKKELENFLSRAEGKDSRAMSVAKSASMTEYGTVYFDPTVYNAKQVSLDRTYQREKDALRTQQQEETMASRQLANVERQSKATRELLQMEERLTAVRNAMPYGSAEHISANSQLKQIKDLQSALENIDVTKKRAFVGSDGKSILGDSYVQLKQQVKDVCDAFAKSANEAQKFEVEANRIQTIIQNIDKDIAKLNQQKFLGNVSDSALNDLAAAAQRLQDIKALYSSAKTDKSLALDKTWMSSLQTERNAANIQAGKALSQANENYNQTLKERARLEQEVSAAAKKLEAEDKARESQILKLQGYIKSLSNELEKSSAKKYTPGTDTSKIEKAREEIQALIDKYKEYIVELKLGGDLYSKQALRRERKGALGSLNTAQTVTNAQSVSLIRQQASAHKQAEDAAKAETTRINQLARANSMLERMKTLSTQASNKSYKFADTTDLKKSISEMNSFIKVLEQLRSKLNSNSIASENMKNLEMTLSSIVGNYRRVIIAANAAEKAQSDAAKAAAPKVQTKAHNDAVDALERQRRGVERLVSEYHRLNGASKSAGTAMSDLKNTLMQFAPIYGIQQLVMSVIEVGGEIEKQHIALQSILGDLHDANTLFEQLKGLAIQSPFTFGELTKDVRQLAAYNVEYNDLYDTTKRLADIASGLGVSFERIALAFGQVKSRSWLDGKELRQFAYAGVPLLQNLSDLYTQREGKEVSKAQVKKMISAREVSFEDVQKVLWDMTDEGGKFYNMQLVLSETLLGRYNKLKDAWEIMLSGFAKGDSVVGSSFKAILDFLTSILLNINAVIPAVTSLFAVFAAKKLANFGSMMVDKGQTAELRKQVILKLQQVSGQQGLNSKKIQQLILDGKITAEEARELGLITGQTVAMGKLGLAAKGVAVSMKSMWAAMGGWVGAAIMAITAAVSYFYTKWSDMQQAVKQSGDEVKDQFKQVQDFQIFMVGVDTSSIDAAKKAVQEYVDFIKENAPYMEGRMLTDLMSTDDINERLNKLEKLVNDLKNGAKYADKYNAEFTENTKGIFDTIDEMARKHQASSVKIENAISEISNDDIAELTKVLEKDANSYGGAIEKGYITMLNNAKNVEEKRSILQKYMQTWNSRGFMPDDTYERLWSFDIKFANAAKSYADSNTWLKVKTDELYEQVVESFGANAQKIKSDPELEAAYRQLLFNAEEKLDDYTKERENHTLDFKLGLDVTGEATQELAEKTFDFLKNPEKYGVDKNMQNTMRMIANKIRYGENTLTDAEKQVVASMMKKAGDEIKDKYPTEVEGTINKLLSKSDFVATIRLAVQVDKPGQLAQDLWKTNDTPEFTQALEKYVNNRTLPEAQKALQDDIDKVKENLNAQKNNKNITNKESINSLQSDLDKLLKVQERVGKYVNPKSTGNGNKNHRDFILIALQKRLEAIEKLITLYKKYEALYGKIEANRRVQIKAHEEGIDNIADWSKEKDVRQYIADEAKKLVGKGRKEWQEARKSYWQGKVTNVETAVYDDEKKVVDALVKSYTELNSQLKTQYDLRDNIRQKYGKSFAQEMASGVTTYTEADGRKNIQLLEDYDKDIEQRLQKAIDKVNERDKTSWSLEGAMDMDEYEILKAFGKDGDIIQMIKDLRQARMDIQKAASDAIIAELDKSQGMIEKLRNIQNEADLLIEKINKWNVNDENGNPDPKKVAKRDAAIQSVENRRDYQMTVGGMDYFQYTKTAFLDSEQYVKEMARTIKNELTMALKNGAITAEEYAEKVGEIDNVMKANQNNHNAVLNYSSGGIQGLVDKYKNEYTAKSNDYAKQSEAYKSMANKYAQFGNTEQAKYFSGLADEAGDNASKFGEMSEAMDEFGGSIGTVDMIIKLVNGIIQGVKGVLDKVVELQEAYGKSSVKDSDAYTFVSAFAEASQNATDAWDSLKNGDAAGVMTGVVGSWTSWWVVFAKAHDAKLDKDIQTSERLAKAVETLADNIKYDMEANIGKLYSNDSVDYSDLTALKDKYSALFEVRGTEFEHLTTGELKKMMTEAYLSDNTAIVAKFNSLKGEYTYLSEDARQALYKAVDTGSYFDYQIASLKAEYDEIARQRQDEDDKKNTDSDKLAEYDQQLVEKEREIKEFAETMAEELYGIDFESYAQSLASALVDAWASGTKSAKAYKEAVGDALKSVAQNMLQQKILGTYLDDNLDKWVDKFAENSGVMDDELFGDLASIFGGLQDRVELFGDTMDALESVANEYGYTMKDSTSSSLSNAIQGVTEDTADLLASYMNAIRADVSLNRGYLQMLTEETIPEMGSTLTMSLSELRGIRSTLDAMALTVENISDKMDDVIYGRKNFSVKLTNIA